MFDLAQNARDFAPAPLRATWLRRIAALSASVVE
jgi:hypothetical protein